MAGATAPLLGLEKKSLREQALAALRTAITSGELEPGPPSGGNRTVRHAADQPRNAPRGPAPARAGRPAVRRTARPALRAAPGRQGNPGHLRRPGGAGIPGGPDAVRTAGPPHVIASLRSAIDAMAAAAEATLEERIESDLEFHRTMCRLTGNETLLHSWESLEGSIRMSIMFAGLEKGVRNMSVDRHHDIVAAIETGDAGAGPQNHPRTHGRRRSQPGGASRRQ